MWLGFVTRLQNRRQKKSRRVVGMRRFGEGDRVSS
nr:MAG TPA: hypothetical protein [Caudoviricetes sp.]